MNDPYQGSPSDKQRDVDNARGDSEPESLEKEVANQPGAGKSGTPRISDPNAEKELGRLDISINLPPPVGGLPAGGLAAGGPQFAGRKSEFSLPFEKPGPQLQPMITDFLKNTLSQKEEPIGSAAQKELEKSRESLSNAANVQEVVANALHLARLYQHLRYIEEAKKAIDFSLGIDPDNPHGRQLFKELERMHSAEISAQHIVSGGNPLSKSNLRKRILSLTGGKVVVVGDLLIDELLEGRPERISREAPVLILEHVDTQLIPGGAANTAHNLAALGGVCHAIGVCGQDEYAARLRAVLERSNISCSLVEDFTRPTTVKTRILSKSHSFKQQLLRLDRISHDPIGPQVEKDLIARVQEVASNYQAIILSDYRAGVMTDEVIRACRAAADRSKVLLVVDAQDDFARFQNVGLLTPNQPDAEKAVGYPIKSKEDLERAAEELLMITGAKMLLITRGGEGMALIQANEPIVELPPFNRSEVFDVSGAGDTVVATMTLALVTGSSPVEAMALGNLAAGIVVKKPGTAVTSQKEMLENLDALKLPE